MQTLCFAAVFAATLQSFYYGVSLSAMSVVPLLVLAAARAGTLRIHPERDQIPITAFVVMVAAIPAALLVHISAGVPLEPRSTIAVCLSIATGALFFLLFAERPALVYRAARATVIIHLVAAWVQIAYYVATGSFLDYIALAGVDQGAVWQSQKGLRIGGDLFPRYTGLFNEPGTFSAMLFPLFVLLRLYVGRTTPLIVVGLLTITLSMSLFGIVLTYSYLLLEMTVAARSWRRAAKVGVPLLLFTALAVYVLAEPIALRLASDYAGTDFREAAMETWWHSPIERKLIGYGIDLATYFPEGAVGGNGLLFVIVASIGLPGALMVATLLGAVWVRSGLLAALLIGLVLMTKVKFTYPLFFVAVAAALTMPPRWRAYRNARCSGR